MKKLFLCTQVECRWTHINTKLMHQSTNLCWILDPSLCQELTITPPLSICANPFFTVVVPILNSVDSLILIYYIQLLDFCVSTKKKKIETMQSLFASKEHFFLIHRAFSLIKQKTSFKGQETSSRQPTRIVLGNEPPT